MAPRSVAMFTLLRKRCPPLEADTQLCGVLHRGQYSVLSIARKLGGSFHCLMMVSNLRGQTKMIDLCRGQYAVLLIRGQYAQMCTMTDY